MPESLPARGVISTENWITDLDAAIISVTSEKNLFRKENLLDPYRGRRWRSTSAVQQKIVVKLAVADTPQVIAFADLNADTGQTITVKQASDSAITTAVSTWNFTSYAQSRRNMLRFYPGTPDSGVTPAVDQLYFEITLPASGTRDSDGDGVEDAYWEIGALWFGNYNSLTIAELQREVIDPSLIAVSDGGARFPDTRDTHHEISIGSNGIPEAEMFALMDKLDAAGAARHVFLDLWASSSDATKKANGAYYGTLGSREAVASVRRQQPQYDALDLTFLEARA